MLEKQIEAQIKRYAESRNCLFLKFVSPSLRGVPDRIVISPGGSVGFMEIKRAGEKPTRLQAFTLESLQTRNCHVTWVDNLEDAKTFINGLLP